MRTRILAAAATAAALVGLAAVPAQALPKPVKYKNCTALRKVYKHGVGRKGAKDKTSGKPVTTFTVYTAAYKKNTALDRDKDGIACEKR